MRNSSSLVVMDTAIPAIWETGHELPRQLHAGRDIFTRAETLATLVQTRGASMSTLTKDVKATGMPLAHSTEAQQHRACQVTRVKKRGRPIELDMMIEDAGTLFVRKVTTAAWLAVLPMIPQVVSRTLSMTPSLLAVWPCTVRVEDAWISTRAVGSWTWQGPRQPQALFFGARSLTALLGRSVRPAVLRPSVKTTCLDHCLCVPI